MNEVAAITYFFNFEDDLKKVESFVSFKNSLEAQGIPLYVIEITPEGKSPYLKGVCKKEFYYLQRTLYPLLAKGNALNIIYDKVPKTFKNIIWFDDKVKIKQDNWLENCLTYLSDYKLVRLSESLKHKSPQIVRRDFFEKVGMFDFDFCGTSNLIFYSCLKENLLDENNDLINLYKDNNIDVYYRMLSYKQDCDIYFDNKIKDLNLKVETPHHVEDTDYIKLLKTIDVETNISYQDKNKLISVKNIKEIKYYDTLLELLK